MTDNLFNFTRRGFLFGIGPFCALACFGGPQAMAILDTVQHKFDEETDRASTIRQYYQTRYGEMIKLVSALEKEWGRKKTIDFLKRAVQDRMLEYGRNQASELNDNSFKTYVDIFRGPAFKKLLTMEIVEDTDTAFELKVTECIWARTFLDAGAGEFGYAHICYGDYYWSKGFNPKISMVRDKTLMQGHAFCNHRYMLKD
jgi:hypothetical protein